MLKITVLLENSRAQFANSLQARAGLSLLIQQNNKTLLFDTGPDDSFLLNAKSIQLNLDNAIDMTIISHGHYDHCGGIPYLPHGSKILCHPDMAVSRHAAVNCLGHYLKLKKISLDIDYSPYQMFYSKQPFYVSDTLIWSGEIPTNEPTSYGILDTGNKDDIHDEGALICKTKDGLVIVIGCGHRGVENIIKHCQVITGIHQIRAVIGGFHLRSAQPKRILKLNQFFKKEAVQNIYACHCTGAWGRLWLSGAKPLRTGDILTFD